MLDFSLFFFKYQCTRACPSFKSYNHSFIHPEVFIVYLPKTTPALLPSGWSFLYMDIQGLIGKKEIRTNSSTYWPKKTWVACCLRAFE